MRVHTFGAKIETKASSGQVKLLFSANEELICIEN